MLNLLGNGGAELASVGLPAEVCLAAHFPYLLGCRVDDLVPLKLLVVSTLDPCRALGPNSLLRFSTLARSNLLALLTQRVESFSAHLFTIPLFCVGG